MEITFLKSKTICKKNWLYIKYSYSYLPNIGLKYNQENYDIGARLIELIETIDKEINDKNKYNKIQNIRRLLRNNAPCVGTFIQLSDPNSLEIILIITIVG